MGQHGMQGVRGSSPLSSTSGVSPASKNSDPRHHERPWPQMGMTLLDDVGVGLGFLATLRPHGGPRAHSMCTLVSNEGLFAFIVPSPKPCDLLGNRAP